MSKFYFSQDGISHIISFSRTRKSSFYLSDWRPTNMTKESLSSLELVNKLINYREFRKMYFPLRGNERLFYLDSKFPLCTYLQIYYWRYKQTKSQHKQYNFLTEFQSSNKYLNNFDGIVEKYICLIRTQNGPDVICTLYACSNKHFIFLNYSTTMQTQSRLES